MHELTAGYALDALEPDEARAYESHLGRCAPCREELAELGDLTEALAHAVPAAAPPAELRRRILAAARPKSRPTGPGRPRWALPAVGLAVTASCTALVLGVLAATRPSPARLRTLPLRGATGALVLSGDRSAVLIVSGLRPAPGGRTYEIWVMKGATSARRAGIFSDTGKTARVRLSRRVETGSFVGVTLERAGGVTHPTGAPLFRSAPA